MGLTKKDKEACKSSQKWSNEKSSLLIAVYKENLMTSRKIGPMVQTYMAMTKSY